MKILVLSDRYPPHFDGGYELNCEVKAKGLEARGHEITVLTSMHGVERQCREGNGFRYMHPLTPEYGTGLSRRLAQLENAYRGRLNYQIASKFAAENKPDLAYIWRMGNVSVFPVLAVCKKKVPVVYELGDYWLLQCKDDFVQQRSRMKKLYRKTLFGGFGFDRLDFTNMIMVSNALKRSYDKGNFTGSNTTVIPAGVSREFVLDEKCTTMMRNDGEFRLLFAGRIVDET